MIVASGLVTLGSMRCLSNAITAMHVTPALNPGYHLPKLMFVSRQLTIKGL
jgi:hypothetical protein